MNRNHEVIIVGAGLAGLACAAHLKKHNISYVIFEGGDAVGGRIRTDSVDGFLLDRGFQVLLTAYPEAKRMFNYDKLDLQKYSPGALVRSNGKFHRISDPFREPEKALETLMSPIGNLSDKLHVARMRLTLMGQTIQQTLTAPETTTLEYLRGQGFSDAMIDQFFRPFFGGIFLEPHLETSSRKFAFLFRMFSAGDTAVPLLGMEELPKQLAQTLGMEHIHLNTEVSAVADNKVVVGKGETFNAPYVVLATNRRSLGNLLYDIDMEPTDRSTTCLYFAARKPPIEEPTLLLNGDGKGPINNLCVPSNISAAYAPEGQSLVSVTVIGTRPDNATLESSVREQLEDWFGSEVKDWRRLRTYRIDHALPRQNPPTNFLPQKYEVRPGTFVCGDHMSTGSINGALESGRMVAEAIVARSNALTQPHASSQSSAASADGASSSSAQ
ncbi:MAG: NAD(P)/FAD-dependent oxidoreductase [Candidatus Melainabacteria bacterium]|nr:NAD(P)/FAD-dependent oxidoreductase [Candidatus Melainabacteria bacterium]